MKTETESVKIDSATVEECRKIARAEGRTLSGLMKILLELGLEKWKGKVHA
jgi:hypothetical protein